MNLWRGISGEVSLATSLMRRITDDASQTAHHRRRITDNVSDDAWLCVPLFLLSLLSLSLSLPSVCRRGRVCGALRGLPRGGGRGGVRGRSLSLHGVLSAHVAPSAIIDEHPVRQNFLRMAAGPEPPPSGIAAAGAMAVGFCRGRRQAHV